MKRPSKRRGEKEKENGGATECTTGCSYGPLFMLQADLAKSSSRMLGLGALTVEWSCWLHKPCQKHGFLYFKNEMPPLLEAQMQHLVSYGPQMLCTKGSTQESKGLWMPHYLSQSLVLLLSEHRLHYLFDIWKLTAGLILCNIQCWWFLVRMGLVDVTARLISFMGQSVYEWEPVELHNQSLFPCVLSVSTPPHYWQTAPPVVSLFPHLLLLLLLSACEQKRTETPMKWWELLIAHLLFGWIGRIRIRDSVSLIALIAWLDMAIIRPVLCLLWLCLCWP